MALVYQFDDSSRRSLNSSYNSFETLPTIIAIEPPNNDTERTPLLRNQWQHSSSGYQSIRTYGIHSPTAPSSIPSIYRRSESFSLSNSSHRKEVKVNLCDLRLFAVFFISIGGFVIASYLLIAETRIPALGFTLELVNHDIWSKVAIPMEAFLNHSTLSNVFVVHTGGPSCDSSISCTNLLNEMQHHERFHQTEMPYNFLVGDDGQTYEVRGWDYASGYNSFSQSNAIVIGFIGNFTHTIPNGEPLQSALSLIKESVRRKKLLHNYRIYGVRNVTTAQDDAEALFRHVANWPHFDKLLNTR